MRKLNLYKIAFFFIIGVGIYIFMLSILINVEELHPDASIKNWSDALWYSAVTLTTVGYGDMVPHTFWGRFIGSVFILFSMGIYGLLIGQFTNIMNTLKENRKLGMNGTNFKQHIVVIGWTEYGQAVTDQLVAAHRKVAIVTMERDNIDIIREKYSRKDVFVLFADYNNPESLHKANIIDSNIVFVNLRSDTEKLVYILNLKKHLKDLTYIVTLDNANLKSTFHSAGVTYAISKYEISSKLLASYIFEPDVAQYSEEIISYAANDDEYDIKQFAVVDRNPYNGIEYEKVFYDLKKEFNAVLIGVVKTENGEKKLHKNPETGVLVQEGDYLIMIANLKSERKITKIFHTSEGL